MKYIIFLFSFMMGWPVFGQINLLNTDFSTAGDTVVISTANEVEVDFTATGADYLWDFEFLTVATQRIDTFFNVAEASWTYQLVFNNGWFDPDYEASYYTNLVNFPIPSTEDIIGVSMEKPVGFTKIEDEKVEIVGLGIEVAGIEVPVKYDIIDTTYNLPFSYGDSWAGNAYFEIDLNPIYDGVFRRHSTRSTEVDGWGELTTPLGTFDVVRTRAEVTFTDSLRILFGETPIWIPLPTPTEITYSYWTKDEGVPVLEIVTQETMGVESVSSVEFKDDYLGEVSIVDDASMAFEIFPNPATNYLHVKCELGADYAEIQNSTGQTLITKNRVGNWLKMDVSSLSPGIYFLRLHSGNHISTKKFVVE